ncbi:MAG: hypothetical protein JWP52_1011, partial [Rhizobacter sp.]|nr:hypothetical protein [Rhizobacter sp.]
SPQGEFGSFPTQPACRRAAEAQAEADPLSVFAFLVTFLAKKVTRLPGRNRAPMTKARPTRPRAQASKQASKPQAISSQQSAVSWSAKRLQAPSHVSAPTPSPPSSKPKPKQPAPAPQPPAPPAKAQAPMPHAPSPPKPPPPSPRCKRLADTPCVPRPSICGSMPHGTQVLRAASHRPARAVEKQRRKSRSSVAEEMADEQCRGPS